MLLRRSSAAARQLVWTVGLAASLVLPLVTVTVPAVQPKVSRRVAVIAAAAIDSVRAEAPAVAPQPVHLPWRGIYAAGLLWVLARLLFGCVRVARIASRSHAFPGASAQVRITDRLTLPVTWGLLKPVILLPTAALEWPPERLRLVLAHEMAHIRRWDFPGRVAAQFACAIYWFHPLAWWAFQQLVKEREQACDDEVLNMGVQGTVYADHLLNIIRSARQQGSAVFSPAVGMAQRSGFEHRVKAMLNPDLNRRAPSRRMGAVTAVLAAILLIPFGALRLTSQTATASIQGSVRDPSGAVVPHANILAANSDGKTIEGAVSAADGSFQIVGILPGHYRIQVTAPGFAAYQQSEIAVTAGSVTKLDPEMNVGSVSESFEVIGKRAAGQPITTPQRIRVCGMVQASKLLNQIPPVYPEAAQQEGIEGTVLLKAVIGADGRLLSLGAASASSDPELTKAALDAVQQWTYEPTLLNGEPVEVTTTIAVTFRLQ